MFVDVVGVVVGVFDVVKRFQIAFTSFACFTFGILCASDEKYLLIKLTKKILKSASIGILALINK